MPTAAAPTQQVIRTSQLTTRKFRALKGAATATLDGARVTDNQLLSALLDLAALEPEQFRRILQTLHGRE